MRGEQLPLWPDSAEAEIRADERERMAQLITNREHWRAFGLGDHTMKMYMSVARRAAWLIRQVK